MEGGTSYSSIVPPEFEKTNTHTQVGDIYMFGLCLFTIMHRPSTYSFPIRDKIEHLSTYISNDDVRKTIQKCCENDPNQRFQSFSDVIDDIESWSDDTGNFSDDIESWSDDIQDSNFDGDMAMDLSGSGCYVESENFRDEDLAN